MYFSSRVMLLSILLVFSGETSVFADRFALLIGNGDYKNDRLDLRNPAKNIEYIARKLKRLNFDVTAKNNLTNKEILSEVNAFVKKNKKDKQVDFFLFYYSGHGGSAKIQVADTAENMNLLFGIDSTSLSDEKAVSLTEVLEKIDGIGKGSEATAKLVFKAKLVFIEACREEDVLVKGASASKGLAKNEKDYDQLFRLFAASYGQKAWGNKKKERSYFAEALGNYLSLPNRNIQYIATEISKKVRKNVMHDLGKKQTPVYSSTLTLNVILNRRSSSN